MREIYSFFKKLLPVIAIFICAGYGCYAQVNAQDLPQNIPLEEPQLAPQDQVIQEIDEEILESIEIVFDPAGDKIKQSSALIEGTWIFKTAELRETDINNAKQVFKTNYNLDELSELIYFDVITKIRWIVEDTTQMAAADTLDLTAEDMQEEENPYFRSEEYLALLASFYPQPPPEEIPEIFIPEVETIPQIEVFFQDITDVEEVDGMNLDEENIEAIEENIEAIIEEDDDTNVIISVRERYTDPVLLFTDKHFSFARKDQTNEMDRNKYEYRFLDANNLQLVSHEIFYKKNSTYVKAQIYFTLTRVEE